MFIKKIKQIIFMKNKLGLDLLGLYLFFVLVLLGNSFAVLNIEITGKIVEYDAYQEQINFNYNCNDEIAFNFPKDAKDIHYINNTQIINPSNFIISDCKNSTQIIYTLDVAQKTSSTEERLERRFTNLENINYSYSLEIPHEYMLDKNNTIPQNYTITLTDRYKLITFSKSDVYLVYYTKEQIEQNSFSLIKLFEETSEIWVIILIVVFFILGFITAFFIYRKNTKEILAGHVPSYILSKEEKAILQVIEKNPGINQKLIGNELNFSKARVSAFATDLEQKGLIRRERFGRSFKVYLNKKIV